MNKCCEGGLAERMQKERNVGPLREEKLEGDGRACLKEMVLDEEVMLLGYRAGR